MAQAIVNRLLHDPTVRMKELRDDRVHARMALVRDLFGLRGRDRRRRTRTPAAAEPLAEVRELRSRQLIRIGTRGSALALAQARWVARAAGPDYELVTIRPRRPRCAVGDKSRWVCELERALLDGRDRPRRALGQGRAGGAGRWTRRWWRSRRGRTRATRSAARLRR